MKDTTATNAPATVELGADLSPAVAALEQAYRMIQARHGDVPNATIVVKRDAKAWGHTTVAHAWSPSSAEAPDRLEIMISGENLARGAQSVAATLLHEAAHARDLAAGILDTDVNGRHNKKFKASAEALGLTVGQNGWHGWNSTTLEGEALELWADMVAVIAAGISKSAKAHFAAKVKVPTGAPEGQDGDAEAIVVPPRKRGDRNLIKAVCGCGGAIRASRGVLERCRPTCEECQEPFVEMQKL